MNEELGKALETVGRGVGLGGLAGAVLRDPKFPDPVIPADLHLVRPVHADADGNVNCLYCGRAVKFEAAQMVGSSGYECGTCQHAFNQEQPVLDTKIGPRKWPWIVAGVAAVGIAIGVWQLMAKINRDNLAKEYPIALSDEEQDRIDGYLDRWDVDKVVAALDNQPKFESLKLGAACNQSFALGYSHRVGRKGSHEVRSDLEHLVKSASRGRYQNELQQLATTLQIPGPILSVRVIDEVKPHLVPGDQPLFEPGVRTGTAYLYDIDGTLLCAAAFKVESSEVVNYEKYALAYAEQETNKVDASDRSNVERELEYDLDQQMKRALEAGFKKVD